MATTSGNVKIIEHNYFKSKEKVQDRSPSFMISQLDDHQYSKAKTPVKDGKRKRDLSSPTGKTPTQAAKIPMKTDKPPKSGWTSEEKVFLTKYVQDTPRDTNMPLLEYWKKCADKINMTFPDNCRNGNSCKSIAQRLLIAPETSSISSHHVYLEDQESQHIVTSDQSTQTDFTTGPDRKEGDWIFLEPKKDLPEDASVAAQLIHKTVLKRLRQYAPLSRAEKANLIDLIYNATPQQMARGFMSVPSLREELKNIMLFDIEMEAQECSNNGSELYIKHYKNLTNFSWENIIGEITNKQTLLAEVLLAISLPKNKIGNVNHTQALVPVLGTAYAMLMKQRYQALSGVQKMISAALANEQTHQKVTEFTI